MRILLHAAAMPDERHSIAEAAEAHGISRNHLMKVVNELAHVGLLDTQRGRGGGFTLAPGAADVTLGAVVRLTEPDLQPADCAHCTLQAGCGLTPLLNAASHAFLEALDQHTLADAVAATNLAVTPLAAHREPATGGVIPCSPAAD